MIKVSISGEIIFSGYHPLYGTQVNIVFNEPNQTYIHLLNWNPHLKKYLYSKDAGLTWNPVENFNEYIPKSDLILLWERDIDLLRLSDLIEKLSGKVKFAYLIGKKSVCFQKISKLSNQDKDALIEAFRLYELCWDIVPEWIGDDEMGRLLQAEQKAKVCAA